MAFPTVVSITQTTFESNVTDHDADLPATVSAGDLLLVLAAFDGSGGVTTPDDYEVIVTTVLNYRVCALIADGTEGGGTIRFTTSGSETGAVQVYRITNFTGNLTSIVRSVSGGTSNPPLIEFPWGATDTLCLAVLLQSASGSVSAAPTNYTNLTDTTSGSGSNDAQVTSSRRNVSTSSEDPAGYTSSRSNAATLAVTIGILATPWVTEESVAGSLPAMSGALTNLRLKSLAGEQSFTGDVRGVFANKLLTGALPSMSGQAARVTLVEVAGDMPAPTGAIGRQLLLKQTLSGELGAFSGRLRQSSFVLPGSLPSPTGALSDRTLAKRLTGELSATGEVEIGHPLRLITLQGALGQPSGVLTSNAPGQVSLAGTLGAFAGALAAQQSLQRDLAGAMPAPSGTLAVKYLIELAGELSATGELDVVQFLLVSLSGAMPAPTGDLDVLYQIALAGSLPAQSGALDPLAMLRHTPRGNLPAPAGSLAVRRLYTQILVAGVLAATGSIRGVNLTARPPAMRPGAGRFNRPRPGSGRL